MSDVSFRLSSSLLQHRIRVSDDARYLTAGQVRVRFGGVSDMWIWRHMRDHGFPQPVRFGGPTSARHWLISEIEAWERRRAAKHDAGAPFPTNSTANGAQ